MFQSSIGERRGELRALLTREAHVWISELEAWRRAPLLTPAEDARARRLRHPDAQASFVAGRSLIRFALSQYAEIEPAAWEFGAGRQGRPEITGPAPVPRLRFNLSHTRGLAACVVTAEADCGVDVECLERPLRPLRIAEHSFAPEEFEDLERQASEDLRERFFSYWTLKESYYKARGSGIPFRMTGARFGLDESGGVDFQPIENEHTAGPDWQFALYRPTGEHVMAIALAPGPDRRLEIRVFSGLTDVAGSSESELGPIRSTRAEIAV
ncbi:MAG: 4'-phosphopantetheinyl transferase family protein [Thermoanaerobaculia bacterium]